MMFKSHGAVKTEGAVAVACSDLLALPPLYCCFATNQMLPLTASDLTDDAKQLCNMRPKLSGRGSSLRIGKLKQLSLWNELPQLDATAGPALGLRLAVLPTLIVWLAAMSRIPVQKRISLSIIRPDASIAISDKCSHARGWLTLAMSGAGPPASGWKLKTPSGVHSIALVRRHHESISSKSAPLWRNEIRRGLNTGMSRDATKSLTKATKSAGQSRNMETSPSVSRIAMS
jgi:hypothetical protein